MNAYIEPPPIRSRCLRRITDALTRYAPREVEIVTDRQQADLVLLHVIGRHDRMYREAAEATKRGQRYAIGQWVLRSSQKPETRAWWALWQQAAVIWSYYDLNAALIADGDKWSIPRFYLAPLGVDSDVFHPLDGPRPYAVGITGFDRHYTRPECHREIAAATTRIKATVWHLGPTSPLGSHVTHEDGIDDETLAARYRACRYVSGLRREEGFELPAAEGLLCGARPVLFDTPDFRRWYAPWGVFVPETRRRSDLVAALAQHLAQPPAPITALEWAAAADRFDWRQIIRGFWQRCLA